MWAVAVAGVVEVPGDLKTISRRAPGRSQCRLRTWRGQQVGCKPVELTKNLQLRVEGDDDIGVSLWDHRLPPSHYPPEPSGVPEPLLILPPTFARTDVPFEYGYRQYKYHAPGTKGVRSLAIVGRVGCLWIHALVRVASSAPLPQGLFQRRKSDSSLPPYRSTPCRR